MGPKFEVKTVTDADVRAAGMEPMRWTHPLVEKIITLRAELREFEAQPGRVTVARRQEVMRRSLYLGGLEDAASMALGPDDIAALLADSREGHG